LPGNLPRVLPEGVAAVLDARSWPVSPVFRWLAEAGDVDRAEMFRVFNCGIGMAVVVAEADAPRACAMLQEAGEAVYRIGRLEPVAGPASVNLGIPDGWPA
jgi:phosphoribosylformylglycinamidine cyclo-ligase